MQHGKPILRSGSRNHIECSTLTAETPAGGRGEINSDGEKEGRKNVSQVSCEEGRARAAVQEGRFRRDPGSGRAPLLRSVQAPERGKVHAREDALRSPPGRLPAEGGGRCGRA